MRILVIFLILYQCSVPIKAAIDPISVEENVDNVEENVHDVDENVADVDENVHDVEENVDNVEENVADVEPEMVGGLGCEGGKCSTRRLLTPLDGCVGPDCPIIERVGLGDTIRIFPPPIKSVCEGGKCLNRRRGLSLVNGCLHGYCGADMRRLLNNDIDTIPNNGPVPVETRRVCEGGNCLNRRRVISSVSWCPPYGDCEYLNNILKLNNKIDVIPNNGPVPVETRRVCEGGNCLNRRRVISSVSWCPPYGDCEYLNNIKKWNKIDVIPNNGPVPVESRRVCEGGSCLNRRRVISLVNGCPGGDCAWDIRRLMAAVAPNNYGTIKTNGVPIRPWEMIPAHDKNPPVEINSQIVCDGTDCLNNRVWGKVVTLNKDLPLNRVWGKVVTEENDVPNNGVWGNVVTVKKGAPLNRVWGKVVTVKKDVPHYKVKIVTKKNDAPIKITAKLGCIGGRCLNERRWFQNIKARSGVLPAPSPIPKLYLPRGFRTRIDNKLLNLDVGGYI